MSSLNSSAKEQNQNQNQNQNHDDGRTVINSSKDEATSPSAIHYPVSFNPLKSSDSPSLQRTVNQMNFVSKFSSFSCKFS